MPDTPAAVPPLCRCGHGSAYHDATPGGPQCRLCPEDGERMWRHPHTPAAICAGGTPGLDYDGPAEDCPVHGAVRGLNKALAERDYYRDLWIADAHEAVPELLAELNRARAEREALARRVTDLEAEAVRLSGLIGERDAEVERLSGPAAAAGEYYRRAGEAEAKLHALAQVRVWQEDGRGFLHADDVAAALGISEQAGTSEAEHRARVLREAADRADGMGYTWGPLVRQWADEAEAEPCTCEPDGLYHAADCPVAPIRQTAAEVERLRAELDELRRAMAAERLATEGAVTQAAAAIRALHTRHTDSDHCQADGEPRPCPTRAAVTRVADVSPDANPGRESGACSECGEPPSAWCQTCAGCSCNPTGHGPNCPADTTGGAA